MAQQQPRLEQYWDEDDTRPFFLGPSCRLGSPGSKILSAPSPKWCSRWGRVTCPSSGDRTGSREGRTHPTATSPVSHSPGRCSENRTATIGHPRSGPQRAFPKGAPVFTFHTPIAKELGGWWVSPVICSDPAVAKPQCSLQPASSHSPLRSFLGTGEELLRVRLGSQSLTPCAPHKSFLKQVWTSTTKTP